MVTNNKINTGLESDSNRRFTRGQNNSMIESFYLREMKFDEPIVLTLDYVSVNYADDYSKVRGHLLTLKNMFEIAWEVPLGGIWKIESQSYGGARIREYVNRPSGLSNHFGRGRAKMATREFEEWVNAAWRFITDQDGYPDLVKVESAPSLHEVQGSFSNPELLRYEKTTVMRDPNLTPLYWEGSRMSMWGRHGLKKMREDTQTIELTTEEFVAMKESLNDKIEPEFGVRPFNHGSERGGQFFAEGVNHLEMTQEALAKVKGDINDN